MFDTTIILSYGIICVIIITPITLAFKYNKKRKKLYKKNMIVLQHEEIIPSSPVLPTKLVLEVNNKDEEQWSIVH